MISTHATRHFYKIHAMNALYAMNAITRQNFKRHARHAKTCIHIISLNHATRHTPFLQNARHVSHAICLAMCMQYLHEPTSTCIIAPI